LQSGAVACGFGLNKQTVVRSGSVWLPAENGQDDAIPQGSKRVAGCRSAAETPGSIVRCSRILKGCQRASRDADSGIPSGCVWPPRYPGVSAALRHPGYCLSSLRDESRQAAKDW